MGGGGEWQNEVWTDLRSDSRIRLERTCGYSSVGKASFVGLEWLRVADFRRRRSHRRLGGYSAYQHVFGSNPADPSGGEDKDEDISFTEDTVLSEQFALQWRHRAMARKAAPDEVTNR